MWPSVFALVAVWIVAAPPTPAGAAPSLEELGVAVADSSGAWTEAELAALRRGAESVPEAIREEVGTVRVRRVHRECPFGLGAYNRSCPTFGGPEDRTLFVYDAPPLQGRERVRRLRILNDEERRELLVRRAVVHGFVALFDRNRGWSEHPRWRQLNGWDGGRNSANRDPWGYSRYLGMRSARLDFVTFAEAYFVRPAEILRESSAPNAPSRLEQLDPDRALACQQFSKVRYLSDRLEALDETWSPPERVDRFPTGCEAFDAWARLDELEGIDLVFAAATADQTESIWGHLLLHVRHTDSAEGFESIYQFGAITGTDVSPGEFVFGGLTGDFYSVLDPVSFRTIDRLFLQYEQRSLRRFRLRLNRSQELRLLQRIWEVERRHRHRYRFFSENCAGMLADVIRTALPGTPIPDRSHVVVSPTDVIELFASVDNDGRGSLLEKLPDAEFSNRQYAQWARRRRRALFARLESSLSGETELGSRFREEVSKLEAADPEVRRRGYDGVAEVLKSAIDRLERGGESKKGELEALARRGFLFLYYSTRIERFYSELHHYRVHEIMAEARKNPAERTAREILRRRRKLYRHEDHEKRHRQRLARQRRKLERFRSAERRPLTESEEAVKDRSHEARRALRAAVGAHREFAQAAALEDQYEEIHAERREKFRRSEIRRDRKSLGPSGRRRILLGGAASFGGRPRGRIDASYSVLHEKFGSHRRLGFRPDIEMRVLGVDAAMPTVRRPYEQLQLDLVIFRYFAADSGMNRARRSVWNALGKGIDLRVGHDGRRGVNFYLQGALGVLYPLAASPDLADHLVLGAFPTVRGAFGGWGATALGGVRGLVRGQIHLYGKYANVLRVEASVTPFFRTKNVDVRESAEIEVVSRHYAGTFGRYPLVLAPFVRAEWSNVVYGNAPPVRELSAGVRFELPL